MWSGWPAREIWKRHLLEAQVPLLYVSRETWRIGVPLSGNLGFLGLRRGEKALCGHLGALKRVHLTRIPVKSH